MIWPSKKVLSVLILIVALVAAIIIAFGRDKSSSAINYASNLVAGEKVSLPENPNWQEELGGVTLPSQTDQTGASASSTETTTDIISRTLMSNYMAMEQNGTLDASSTQKLVSQTINYINTTSGQTAPLTQYDLNVIADAGKQSVADYGEALGNILRNNRVQNAKNELVIINQAMQSNDPSKLNDLDSIISVYEKTTGELTKMPVPKTFVDVHLGLVNAANDIVLSLKESKLIFSDPVKGLAATKLYQDGVVVFSQAMKSIRDFINLNKIIYKQGSGGYYLMNGV